VQAFDFRTVSKLFRMGRELGCESVGEMRICEGVSDRMTPIACPDSNALALIDGFNVP